MRIHFKNIDDHNVAKAQVEIPEQILNHFLVSEGKEGSYVDIPHVRNGSFTRIMGDAALQFTELEDKLPIPDSEHKGIHVDLPEDALTKLGFESRWGASYWHPGFGIDDDLHYILFDVKTDDFPLLIRKIFNLGFRLGRDFGRAY